MIVQLLICQPKCETSKGFVQAEMIRLGQQLKSIAEDTIDIQYRTMDLPDDVVRSMIHHAPIQLPTHSKPEQT